MGPSADAVSAAAPTHKVASHGHRNRTRDAQPDGRYGAECHSTCSLDAVSMPAREAPRRPVPLPALPDVEVRLDVLQNEHEDPDRAALASDTEDGGDDSSDESFDYGYLDGGPVSEPDEEDLEDGGPDGLSPVHERSLRHNARLSEARGV